MLRQIIMPLALLDATGTACDGACDWRGIQPGRADGPPDVDPHAVSSTPVLGFLNNVYEGLVRRGQDMTVEPALAVGWGPIGDGQGWRFNLREGVTFHDGAAFTAEDVLFSYERASSEQSDVSSWFAPVSEVVIVDDYTVDVMTTAPNPILPDSIANWMMVDRDWAEANGTQIPARDAEDFATLNANGTGFMLDLRQPGLETVLLPFDGWWGDAQHNVTRAAFTPIQNPATAFAALISGDVDMINPVPVQDAERLDAQEGVQVIRGIEARVIMLGKEHAEGTLDESEAENPFSDVRIRRAWRMRLTCRRSCRRIMRGSATPADQLVSLAMRGSTPGLPTYAYDPERARELLQEAGYPDGFSFDFNCNDRYLNDEAVCQAIVGMLARVGRRGWMRCRFRIIGRSSGSNFDMYFLGWSPGTFDAEHPMRLAASSEGNLGTGTSAATRTRGSTSYCLQFNRKLTRTRGRRCWTRWPRSSSRRWRMCRSTCSRCCGARGRISSWFNGPTTSSTCAGCG